MLVFDIYIRLCGTFLTREPSHWVSSSNNSLALVPILVAWQLFTGKTSDTLVMTGSLGLWYDWGSHGPLGFICPGAIATIEGYWEPRTPSCFRRGENETVFIIFATQNSQLKEFLVINYNQGGEQPSTRQQGTPGACSCRCEYRWR